MADGNGDRISISRDTLRAELGALELRIVDRITGALDQKADQAHVDVLERRINEIAEHGSPALISTQQVVMKNTDRLSEIERQMIDRAQYIPLLQKIVVKVESLESWRNKTLGAIAVVAALGVTNFLRVWIGIG